MMLFRGFERVNRFKDTDIKLPERSTKYSAGYDFFAPEDITIPSILNPQYYYDTNKIFLSFTMSYVTNYDNSLKLTDYPKPFCIKSGIKAYMEDDEVLQLYIRSSSPSKLGLVMANSVAIIDKDYYGNNDNDGEIGFLVYNITGRDVIIHKDDKIGQGIFYKYLLTDDDSADGIRSGGFGSTGK